MNLYRMLQARAEAGRPVRVGLIGAGKFGSMFLSQARHTPGLHLLGVADLSVDRARRAMATTGWPDGASAPASFAQALAGGGTFLTEDSEALIAADGMEVVIDATGDPGAGIRHVLACCHHRRHVVMVNVEADALAGPLLARKAAEAGIVYSLAYGDQPALICEQVDWARACGFRVVAAGKGTLYMPEFHASTPDTVWDHYGLDAARAAASGMNAKMFNSFLDGTKSGIEMTAVANACGLAAAPGGLEFPPCAVGDLARTLIPHNDGGCLHQSGQVEVVSSRGRDGVDIAGDLRWGVYVTFEAPSDYVERCFADYGLITDPSGRYTALWRPYHLIGLELGVSVASVALRGEPTGAPREFRADVVATAKRDLAAGEVLDGEGGFMVWGRLMPAAESVAHGALPIGLAHGVALTAPVAAGQVLRWRDVAIDQGGGPARFRREMEQVLAPA
ncbi:MAG: flagellar biosynthesis protein FlgA [Hyphomicrobiales bacterium]|nr:flagellar biosynthesis protein FlgA [Hyphomicrobiales bacterium]MCP5372129.1 flagellar biosynthesis protein FlgA [Hyphomicrobiales bacterium]